MITENDVIFDNLAQEIFPYLDELHETAGINSIGAHIYIMEDFNVNKSTAMKLLESWMETSNIEQKIDVYEQNKKDQLYRYEDKR